MRIASGLLAIIICGVAVPRSSAGSPTGPALPHYERPARGEPYQDRVIVFVHGIYGDAKNTWTAPNGAYWPKLLLADSLYNDSDVYVAGYDSPYWGNTATFEEIVTNLQSRLTADGVWKHREVVFVCHSMGGLLVRRLLVEYRDLGYSKRVPFIFFFATPETGSEIAKLASRVSSDALLKILFPGGQTNDYLSNLENEWREAYFGIRQYCAYEKRPYSRALGVIVSWGSATRNCNKPAVGIEADHVGIVKPAGNTDAPYTAFRSATLENPISRPAPAQTQPQPPAHENPPAETHKRLPINVYDLTGQRRQIFVALLNTQLEPRDIIRVGCIGWSEASCVAAGNFLVLLSQAGWRIDSNRVFRFDTSVPKDGMTIAARSPNYTDSLPPHLGHWQAMDVSQMTIWQAFTWMQIPVSASGDPSMPDGTIGVYFGPEPTHVEARNAAEARQQLREFLKVFLVEFGVLERLCSGANDTCDLQGRQWNQKVSTFMERCGCGLKPSWLTKWNGLAASGDSEPDPLSTVKRQEKQLRKFITALR